MTQTSKLQQIQRLAEHYKQVCYLDKLSVINVLDKFINDINEIAEQKDEKKPWRQIATAMVDSLRESDWLYDVEHSESNYNHLYNAYKAGKKTEGELPPKS